MDLYSKTVCVQIGNVTWYEIQNYTPKRTTYNVKDATEIYL